MSWIIIELNPEYLADPDLDLRYILPDLVIERSAGAAVDGGYTYADDGQNLYLVLETDDVARVMKEVLFIVESELVLNNSLSAAAKVGVKDGTAFRTVYPPGSSMTLPLEVQGLP